MLSGWEPHLQYLGSGLVGRPRGQQHDNIFDCISLTLVLEDSCPGDGVFLTLCCGVLKKKLMPIHGNPGAFAIGRDDSLALPGCRPWQEPQTWTTQVGLCLPAARHGVVYPERVMVGRSSLGNVIWLADFMGRVWDVLSLNYS